MFRPAGFPLRVLVGPFSRICNPAVGCCFLTVSRDFSTDPVFLKDTVAVVSVPVYGGRVAETAVERLSRFHAEDSLAVAVVLYGNRAYDWRAFL